MSYKGSYELQKDPSSPRGIEGHFSDEEEDDLDRTLEVASYEDVNFETEESKLNDDDDDDLNYLRDLIACSPQVPSTDSQEEKTEPGDQPSPDEPSPKPHQKFTSKQHTDDFGKDKTPLQKDPKASHPPQSERRAKEFGEDAFSKVFVEMNELMKDGDKYYWMERGRWIMYEENLDLDTNRWSHPHVPCLSFRSLLEVQRAIKDGAVLLDLKEITMHAISLQIIEEILAKDQIRTKLKTTLLNTLLFKHRHQHDEAIQYKQRTQDIETQGKEEHHKRHHSEIMDKIPENTEGTLVLVGCMESLTCPAMAFVRLEEAVCLESVLEVSIPTRFIIVFLAPKTSNMNYHEIGRSFSTLMSDKIFRQVAYEAKNPCDLLNGIREVLDYSIVISPTEIQDVEQLKYVILYQQEMLLNRKKLKDDKLMKAAQQSETVPSRPAPPVDDDPLKRTGKPFGGLFRDIKRRYPKYLSDIKDALNPQCLAAIIFIYFAALTPAITFGGLLEEKTKGNMGVSELIVSTAIQGVIFSLIGAQPLLILGFSGPLLVFEDAYFNFCENIGVSYLAGRIWVGLWMIIIVLLLVAFEGSFLVRFISRFTQEIFSILISLIFIYETFNKLFQIFKSHPLMKHYNTSVPDASEHPQPNTALLSLVLMSGTFTIAIFLRQLKTSQFFPGAIRRVIGDFGVPIAILTMVLIDYFIKDTFTQKLNVPDGLQVTNPHNRTWFIHPLDGIPYWVIPASVLPAMLIFILIFMESQITTLIVSKPDRKMVKGSGFHLDLLLIVVMGGISSLFGVPWLSATTVRTVTHCNALTVMSKSVPPGHKPQIQEVKEQRITGFAVAILIGLSILIGNILRNIPLAALFGIFLYMGVTSLNGIQLFDRLLLLFIPPKYHPDIAYTRKVHTRRMHIFTLIQLICIAILWAINKSRASLAFPFILILTVPLRMFVLTKIFSALEMKCLDGDDAEPTFDEKTGKDVYDEIPMPS
ncbi:solute carrier family 4 member 1b (Diego blood group) isoform X1 [Hypanus sabinus]|uniref:solute carrier family 4 member 1b (Diego blood group) isoform X1 n=2 Tax=Hypanus sabinus TaxID=79690 RepID=UPI0028C3C916|nr:solute carrier family 4 member 1b (Diego blood group) isoform X1 [Hypanus sabinus]